MAKFILSAFADEAGDSLEEQISALKENGISYIEPRNIGGRSIIKRSDKELKEIRKILDENGIRVNSLGSPIGKFAIEKPLKEHLPAFKRALTACNILGTDNMRIFSFYTGRDERKKYKDEVIARLRKMADIAEEYGVTLCHENESGVYGEMPREVSDLIDSVPKIKAIFDPANYRMNGADIDEGLEVTLKRLAYLHIKDAIYKEHTIVPAGEGEGKISEVIERVNAVTDGTVYLTVEPHLAIISVCKKLDGHKSKAKYIFKNNRESFAFAVNALKKILTDLGYERSGDNLWAK